MPKVGVKVELKDPSSEKLKSTLVLPTPESPIKRTCSMVREEDHEHDHVVASVSMNGLKQ